MTKYLGITQVPLFLILALAVDWDQSSIYEASMSLRPKSGQNQDAMEALSLIKGTCSKTTVAHQQIITLHWILWSSRVMMKLGRRKRVEGGC